jgi:V/A-type H+-transporting ATPase subunit C
MIGLGRRKGNYAYATARVKAKKKQLLTKDSYPKLMMMDLNEIGRFLGETQYKTEMTELGARYSGVNLIELSTSKNLARTYRSVIFFCDGDLKEIIAAYLRRWDYLNIKTVLRGKYSNASLEEIQEDLVPAGNLSEEKLLSLVAMESPKEILDTLRMKQDIDIPIDIINSYEKDGNLAPIEDYLDKLYYEKLMKAVQPQRKPHVLFKSYIKREIDIVNLRTLLKLKHAGLNADKIRPYFIEGGIDLDIRELTRLSSLESFDQMVDELSKLSFYEDIKEALETAKKTGSLNDVMLKLKEWEAQQADKFSHLYPLSVLPIVNYVIRKKIEVDNIRIIARGKAIGMDPETIKKLLVV